MAAEDTGEFRADEIPKLVYRTELNPFNGWDNREFPLETSDHEDIQSRTIALDAEASGAYEYVGDLSEAVRFDVANHPLTKGAWSTAWQMTEHIARNRTLNAAHKRTIKSFPLGSFPYLSREWNLTKDAYGKLYQNLMEAEALFKVFSVKIAEIVGHIENSLDDDYKEFDEFRSMAYEKVRKQLVDKRYRERAAIKKEEVR